MFPRVRWAVLILSLGVAAATAAPSRYTIVDLGESPSSTRIGIDAAATVAGHFGNGIFAIRRDGSVLVAPPDLPFEASAINARGFIGGTVDRGLDSNGRREVEAYSYVTGEFRSFLSAGNTFVTDVDVNGYAVGYNRTQNPDGVGDALTATFNGYLTSFLSTDYRSAAYACSGHGYAGAIYDYSLNGQLYPQAFLYDAGEGELQRLTLPGYPIGYALTANDRNDAGGALASKDLRYRAFIRHAGKITLLDIPKSIGAGSESRIAGMNDDGQAVGEFSGRKNEAFLYENGQVSLLADLVPRGSGWKFLRANGVNFMGYIVGHGINPSGAEHAYLLSPRPAVYVYPYSRAANAFTHKRRISLAGGYIGYDLHATYRVNHGRYRDAKGSWAWHFKTALRPGRNTIDILAKDPTGKTVAKTKFIVLQK